MEVIAGHVKRVCLPQFDEYFSRNSVKVDLGQHLSHQVLGIGTLVPLSNDSLTNSQILSLLVWGHHPPDSSLRSQIQFLLAGTSSDTTPH